MATSLTKGHGLKTIILCVFRLPREGKLFPSTMVQALVYISSTKRSDTLSTVQGCHSIWSTGITSYTAVSEGVLVNDTMTLEYLILLVKYLGIKKFSKQPEKQKKY